MDYYIRPARVEDATGINYIRRMRGVMENILGVPSETIKRSEDYLASIDENKHQFVAVTCLDNGKELVIGTASLHVNTIPRMRHSATLGIMVHKDYQGMGVGERLMEALIDMADNWLMLMRLELNVFVDNEKAIALYKKMGFEYEGTLRKAAARDGEYIDEFIMSRIREI